MRFRFILGFLLCLTVAGRAMPPELSTALANFRADGPKGWAFTQSTKSDRHSMVERYNPLTRPPFSWSLQLKDGHPPTEKDLAQYQQKVAFRSNDGVASVKDQIIPESCELVSQTDDTATYSFKLKPGAPDDRTAEFMTAYFTLHRPTRTIIQVELGNHQPFSPMLAVKVTEARTTMNYSVPTADTPSFLLSVHTKMRGKAFWVRSLDDDLYVAYTDHTYVSRIPRKSAEPVE